MRLLLTTGVIVGGAVTLSYLFARAGEPQSAWLWCSVAGAC